MDRYTGSTAASTPDAIPSGGTPGFFTNGVVGSKARTILEGWYQQLLVEEIRNVIVGAGLAPNIALENQLLLAVQALVSAGGAGALLKANNLSDLSSVVAALGNLGFTLMVNVSGSYWNAVGVIPMSMGGTLKNLIFQMGYAPITAPVDGGNPITFPITFPTKALYGNYVGNEADNVADSAPSLAGLTTTQMLAVNTYGGNTAQYWISAGY